VKKVIVFRRLGWFYIAASIAMGVLALSSGNNFHYLAFAAMLGYALASGIEGRRNIRSADVSLSFPDEIYARTPFQLTVNVRCGRRAPIYMIDVGVGQARAFFPCVRPGEPASKLVEFELPSRGVHEIGGVETSSGYPIDCFTRYWPSDFSASVTVFPCPALSRGAKWAAGEEKQAAPSGAIDVAEPDTAGVRPYADGDPMRLIHWKSSARTGRLTSRLFDEPAPDGVILDVDSLLSHGAEAGLSAASYEISSAMRSGKSVGMRLNGVIWPPSPSRSAKLDMLGALARYETRSVN
jgi:uncharacterized protein (DUF58 family)